jgi:hypothetical protein
VESSACQTLARQRFAAQMLSHWRLHPLRGCVSNCRSKCYRISDCIPDVKASAPNGPYAVAQATVVPNAIALAIASQTLCTFYQVKSNELATAVPNAIALAIASHTQSFACFTGLKAKVLDQ